ncbi:Chaperone protein DnaK [Enhygromyxa salina]|uniref:Chaperone protein DnaK n=1 Tax=Enhygromyxa salina TaxID=215803 RepID=A0A0C2D359_9BACT|nr:Hsp70 family protein [Enhygromyxa salina]KIG16180.1 Chaperone protein DnaK [Enhygromyxa salina]
MTTANTGVFGIDLGTTNSVIARLHDGVPQALEVDGSAIVPSVVMYTEDGRVLVGREARNLAVLHPDRVVRSIKRRMGQSEPVEVAGKSLLPEQISAEILRSLSAAAQATTGEKVSDVVITVPAYFNDAQRRATLAAGELAGLRVLRLLNEPTAASLVYDHARADQASAPELVLVYDLGGGTFDVSVLEVFEDVREVRATTGNTSLGGDDFDDALVRMFVDELGTARGLELDAAAKARLRSAAEAAKIVLSTELEVEVREEFIAVANSKPVHLQLTVTRHEFEAAIMGMLSTTIELAQRAIQDAKLGPEEQIGRICMVGGSTRIPLVRTLLAEAFEVDIHEEIDVDLAVGLGAAIQCGMLSGVSCDRILVDVAAHSLGLRAVGDEDDLYLEDGPDTFVAVLHRNTALPADRTREMYTMVDDQELVRVDVFQGEAPRCSENLSIGSFELELEPARRSTPVRFRFAYDLDGVVRVTASQVGAEAKQKTVALRLPDATQTQRDPARAGPAAGPATDRATPDLSQIGTDNALIRRAKRLLETVKDPTHAQLVQLILAWQAATPNQREEIEDELLDLFLEQEAGEV